MAIRRQSDIRAEVIKADPAFPQESLVHTAYKFGDKREFKETISRSGAYRTPLISTLLLHGDQGGGTLRLWGDEAGQGDLLLWGDAVL